MQEIKRSEQVVQRSLLTLNSVTDTEKQTLDLRKICSYKECLKKFPEKKQQSKQGLDPGSG